MKRFPTLVAIVAVVILSTGAAPAETADPQGPRRPGTVFRDCPECPEMVVVPAGSFIMGDIDGSGPPLEAPVHRVVIARPFAVGKFEVSFVEWNACVAAEARRSSRPPRTCETSAPTMSPPCRSQVARASASHGP